MLKVKDLSERLNILEKFPDSKQSFTKEELFAWLAECIAIFSYLGINETIIKNFLDMFNSQEQGNPLYDLLQMGPNKIGPFKKNSDRSVYELPKDIFGRVRIEEIHPIKIAFKSAKFLINQKEDEEKLVSKALINVLQGDDKNSHIVASLNDLERAYENRDPDKLISSSLTLLDSILNLDPELKLKNNISQKLTELQTKDYKREKFGIREEYIVALNNSRIIRNIKSIHKNIPLRYDTPFLVGTTFAYLVLTLLEITISQGELI